MKVIKEGKAWWIDVEIICRGCKSIIILDKDDKVKRDASDIISVQFFCPVCNSSVLFKITDLKKE